MDVLVTEDVCKYCGTAVWSNWPNAGGAPWRDINNKSHCLMNPGRRANSFGPHDIWVKPEEIEAAIASIMEARKS